MRTLTVLAILRKFGPDTNKLFIYLVLNFNSDGSDASHDDFYNSHIAHNFQYTMAPENSVNYLDDFILTISDNDKDLSAGSEAETFEAHKGTKRKRKGREPSSKRIKRIDHEDGEGDDGTFNPEFIFEIDDDGAVDDFDEWDVGEQVSSSRKGVDLEGLIQRRGIEMNHDVEQLEEPEAALSIQAEDETLAAYGFGMGYKDEASEDDEDGAEEESDTGQESSVEPTAPPKDNESHEDDQSVNGDANFDERAKEADFFAPAEKATPKAVETMDRKSFQHYSLSRPILRGLAAIGFDSPTPIQHKTIPVALLGKDLVGGAVTGSGKTAAFIVPILERLLYRPKRVRTSRVVILMPTRELAVQCLNVAQKLASFTDITLCLTVGGYSLKEQENVLRSRPDVIIATPGRFIDHMRNSPSFTIDTLEILVLDEADRMLEQGFADELNEIVSTIPRSRQTMLFSATMTSRVDDLVRAGLNSPVRIMVDAKKQTVGTLIQEFVKLRPSREEKRMGYLIQMCTRTFHNRTIIFFRQKQTAHRARIIFGLLGLKAAEFHGSMSQEQRMEAVTSFRNGKVNYLLATDVASRGLDIKDVETVINYEMPQSHDIYIHRVGRTARAGRKGRACTLVMEPDRKLMRAILKLSKAQTAKIASRNIDASDADRCSEKVEAMEADIEAVLADEKEAKLINEQERDIRRGENLIEHGKEIMARPKRTWFESEKEKKAAKTKGAMELNRTDGKGGAAQRDKKSSRSVGKILGKGGKLSNKDKKRLDDVKDRTEGKRLWKKGKGGKAGKGGKGQKVRR